MGKRHSFCYLQPGCATPQWKLDSEGGWGAVGAALCQRPRVLTCHSGGFGLGSGRLLEALIHVTGCPIGAPPNLRTTVSTQTRTLNLPHSVLLLRGTQAPAQLCVHMTALLLTKGSAWDQLPGSTPLRSARRGSDQGPRVLCAASWLLSWWLSSHSQASVLDVGVPACDIQTDEAPSSCWLPTLHSPSS